MENTVSDFTEGRITAKLIRFMIPILGSLILQAAYGAVDVLMVGWFGTTEGLSGVSTGSSIINLVTFVITGLATGITVLLGTFIGSRNTERAGKTIGSAILFFLISGIVLTLVLIVFAEPIAKLMRAPEEALENTVSYVRICGSGIIFIIAYNLISCILRGIGNSRLPLIFVSIACAANIVGDYVLIALFHMDERGAAIATVGAQVISVLLSLLILRKQKLPFSIRRKDIAFSKEMVSFLRIGSPIALQELMTQISFLALIAFINNIDLEASSGYGVANKITTFVMLIPSSLMQSLSSFIAQNAGAGKEDRAKLTMKTGMLIGIAVGIVMFLLAYFKGDMLSHIFASDEGVIARSAEYLKGFAPEAVVTSILFSFMGYFSGHGMTLFVMTQSMLQTFLVRLPVAYIMSIQPDPSLTMIGTAAPLATVFGIMINLWYYLHLKRKRENTSIE